MDPERRSLLTAMLAGIALLGPDADAADVWQSANRRTRRSTFRRPIWSRTARSCTRSWTSSASSIQPFAIDIEALEGKFKLFQERPAPDKAAALPKLDVYRERSLRAFTEHFYQTAPK
jgi:predicted FMN-binding regulatory protein PaiB